MRNVADMVGTVAVRARHGEGAAVGTGRYGDRCVGRRNVTSRAGARAGGRPGRRTGARLVATLLGCVLVGTGCAPVAERAVGPLASRPSATAASAPRPAAPFDSTDGTAD